MDNSVRGLNIVRCHKSLRKFLVLLATTVFLIFSTVNADTQGETQATRQYGPVKSGQTLWGIAYKTRPEGVSRLTMMKVLHQLNPEAFERGNINLLKKGAYLQIPVQKELVLKILAGEDDPGLARVTEEKKDIKTLQNELARVKNELDQSRQALKGLQLESENYKQAQSELERQAQSELERLELENTKLKADKSDNADAAQRELQAMSSKLKASQKTIALLRAEKQRLMIVPDKEAADKLQATEGKLAQTITELKESKAILKTLAEKNKELQTNSLDPKLLEKANGELLEARQELDEIKAQNELLRQQAKTADASDEERREDNRKFSETIAALNADIGQLRARIKELEDLEKLKDAHISELQKSLNRATTVIKEQAEVNKKMYARLNELEKAVEESSDNDAERNAAAATTDSSSTPPPSGGAEEPKIVDFTDASGSNTGEGAMMNVTQGIKHVSPKFWLLLTLAGLLFVLALLWRVMVSHEDSEHAA